MALDFDKYPEEWDNVEKAPVRNMSEFPRKLGIVSFGMAIYSPVSKQRTKTVVMENFSNQVFCVSSSPYLFIIDKPSNVYSWI
jgi:hypothetical protein